MREECPPIYPRTSSIASFSTGSFGKKLDKLVI